MTYSVANLKIDGLSGYLYATDGNIGATSSGAAGSSGTSGTSGTSGIGVSGSSGTSGTSGTSFNIETVAGLLESPTNKSYKLIPNIPYAGTINSTTTISTTGSGTASWYVGATALGAVNAVSVSEVTQTQTTNNTFSIGDDIILIMSGINLLANMSFTIKITSA